MTEPLLIKSILSFVFFWCIGIVFVWFRSRIEVFWKIIATLILAFYIWFFFDDVVKGYDMLVSGWYVFTMNFLKELLALVFINLFFLWPLALFIIFYKSDALGAERLLRFMCLLTLILWIIFIIYFFFSKGIDSFIFENFKKMIPHVP